MVVNFITLKWGTKYGPEYVNRLYANLKNAYTGKFNFYCFTDDAQDINPAIHIRDIQELRPDPTQCFTVEKIFLFDPDIIKLSGNFVLLDLDILIINDLYPYLSSYNFTEGRFIKNYWSNVTAGSLLSKFGWNWINSSFVTWKDDQLKHIIDFYYDNKQVIEFKFGDLDFFLFQGMRNELKYHPKKIVYSYCDGADDEDKDAYAYRKDYSIVLYNTSHGRGVELHEARDWSRDIWTRFG
jgi:hypothetical protein